MQENITTDDLHTQDHVLKFTSLDCVLENYMFILENTYFIFPNRIFCSNTIFCHNVNTFAKKLITCTYHWIA